ncbi:F-box/WD repeat-containing protein 9-like [Bacillus rossius redtenbacheri]|uniref:F-box/WD repeat-containing protein 9-like n=1 Tax=Bacillus rossius redtenbacheri TaxID=93214 RepID=UPI002FDCE917
MNEENSEPTNSYLSNIPVEILLHICSFLDARTIICTLSLVCKRFHEIVSDENIWRSRIAKKCRGSVYPAIPENADVNFRNACIELEEEFDLWSHYETKTRSISLADVHYAAVDAVLLLKEGSLCVSGARDRSLVVWRLPPRDEEGPPSSATKAAAHEGWIWQLVSPGEEALYSASWDHTVKLWDLGPSLVNVSTFRVKCSVLSVACCAGGQVAAGTYTGHVHLFDPRAGCRETRVYRSHAGAALALAGLGHLVVSAGEDGTVAVFDQRAGRVHRRGIALGCPPGLETPVNAYPLSLSLSEHYLYVGDSKGYLHLINPSKGSFEFVKVFDVGHTNGLTGIHHGAGSLITSSVDGSVRMFAPTDAPKPVSVYSPNHGEFTSLSYQNKTLALANTNCSIDVLQQCSS